eukprot:NODE_76_length_23837_cov_1.242396.p4 type:complete len:734 gc:universal NODE_76_length_23837_cov_1.242396:350-2551(+)
MYQQLIDTLYGPSSTPEQRKDAEMQLVAFQKSDNGLASVGEMLKGNFNAQFFGIMTIQVHLVTTNYTISFEEILKVYDVIKSSPQFVIRKYAVVLATVGLKTIPDDFLNKVYQYTQSVPLVLFTAMDLVNTSEKIYQIRLRNHSIIFCKSNSKFVLSIINECLNRRQYCEEAVETFTIWLSRFENTEIQQLYSLLLDLLRRNEILEHVSEAICGIVSAVEGFEESIGDTLVPEISSQKVLELIRSQSDDTESFLKIIMSVGEELTNYLVRNALKPEVDNYFQVLMTITNAPGTFGIDEVISEESLFIWSYIQEAVTEPSSQLCKSFAIDYPDFDPSRFEVPQIIFQKFESIFKTLLVVALTKMAADPKSFSDKPKDLLTQFMTYRSTLCDTVLDVYKICPQYTMEYLYTNLKELLFNAQTRESSVECLLRSFGFLSDYNEEDTTVSKFFEVELLNQSMQLAKNNTWTHVHQQYLLCCGHYSIWFEKNSAFDPTNVINYTMTLLEFSKYQNTSVQAIKGLCRYLPERMIKFAGPLLANIPQFSDTVKIGLLQALSTTTSTLGCNEKLDALQIILVNIHQNFSQVKLQTDNTILLKWANAFTDVVQSFPKLSELKLADKSHLNPFLVILDSNILTWMHFVSQLPSDIELSNCFLKIVGLSSPLIMFEWEAPLKSATQMSEFLHQWWCSNSCSEILGCYQRVIKACDSNFLYSYKAVALDYLSKILLDTSKFSIFH